MVSRTTLLSLALGTVIATAAAVVSFRFHPTDDGEPVGRLLLPDVARYDSFEYRAGDLRIVCRLQPDGSWLLVEPLAAPADAECVQRFLYAVSSAAVRETLDLPALQRRGLTLESLGLQPPGATLDLRSATGAGATLRLATRAVQGRVHVQTHNALLSLDEELLGALPTDPLDFLDDHFLPYASEALRRVEIQRAGAPVLLFQKTASGWTCQQPADDSRQPSADIRVDGAKVDRHFAYLFNRRVRLLHTPPEASDALPVLADPDDATLVARYWFDAADASGQLRYCERRFGSPVPEAEEDADGAFDGPREVYLYSAADRPFAAVGSDVLTALREDVDHFRDKRVFPGRSAEALRSLRIRDKTDALLFVRSDADGGWHLLQPAALDVRPNMFDAFLRDLLSLADTALAPFPADPSSAPPSSSVPAPDAPDAAPAPAPAPELRCELELSFRDGTVETAAVYRAAADLPESATLWKVPDGGAAAHVVPDTALPVPPWDRAAIRALLDTTVFRADAASLSAFSRAIGAAGPSEGAPPLPAEETADLAPLLAPLVAERIEAVAPLSVEPYGLLAPHAALSFVVGAGEAASSASLLFGGAAAGGGRYAMLRGGYTVYVLSDETVRRLLSVPPSKPIP